MNRFGSSERFLFILFCIVNAVFSLNCAGFFTGFVTEKNSSERKEETIMVPQTSIPDVYRSWIQSGRKKYIIFNFKDGKSMCRELKAEEFYLHLYFGYCEKDLGAEIIQTEMICFPARLDLPSDFYRSEYPVFRLLYRYGS